ncbi:hypothetical protein CYMTET_6615 [Cymbomonas tetramitiformis]|uniref:Cyanobacterial aminoacyl-tRNA synthetase CAAD domain-containing protein n=1 Tax=Cymbomonas tetramitiformis TaxID=36881 RepID=A0AAE0GX21_9CHLO|nr:hypothetical protein CYMTET_6615 [Cymbomonas tetramitiformis]|eukprot:gene18861-22535_t
MSSRRRSVKVSAEAEKTETDASAFDADEVIKTLQEKWDSTEDKGSVALYAGGSVLALWISSAVVGAINAVPVLPKLMELIGLGYSSWFVYRYVLFKEGRDELVKDVDTLKAKITGSED